MFRSQFSVYQRQVDLKEEDRIALLEQWKNSGAKPEITGWWNVSFTVSTAEELANAISEIPVGGTGIIFLKKDTIYELTKTIHITNKTITFKATGSGTNNPKIVCPSLITSIGGSDKNTTYHFMLTGSNIFSHGIDYELQEAQDSNLPTWIHSAVFTGEYGISSVNLVNATINLPSTNYFGLADSDGWASQVLLNLTNCTVNTAGAYAYYITNNGVGGYSETNCSYSDDTKKISGIVKDANGVPRNIVSNIVL